MPASTCLIMQERAAELAEHEESLDAWKRQFKEQAMKQIGDRERALADWQAKLEAHDADLAERRATFEVSQFVDKHCEQSLRKLASCDAAKALPMIKPARAHIAVDCGWGCNMSMD